MTGSRAASRVHFTSRAVVGAPSCQRTDRSRDARSGRALRHDHSQRRARYGCGVSDAVVPRERREQDVALDLTRERVKREAGG